MEKQPFQLVELLAYLRHMCPELQNRFGPIVDYLTATEFRFIDGGDEFTEVLKANSSTSGEFTWIAYSVGDLFEHCKQIEASIKTFSAACRPPCPAGAETLWLAAHFRLATLLRLCGRSDEAFQSMLSASEYFDGSCSPAVKALCLSELTWLQRYKSFLTSHDLQTAFLNACDLADSSDPDDCFHTTARFIAHIHLGDHLVERRSLAEAKRELAIANQLAQDAVSTLPWAISDTERALGRHALLAGEVGKAEQSLYSASKSAESLPYTALHFNNNLFLGDTLSRQGKFDAAKIHAQKAVVAGAQLNAPLLLGGAYGLLLKCCANAEDQITFTLAMHSLVESSLVDNCQGLFMAVEVFSSECPDAGAQVWKDKAYHVVDTHLATLPPSHLNTPLAVRVLRALANWSQVKGKLHQSYRYISRAVEIAAGLTLDDMVLAEVYTEASDTACLLARYDEAEKFIQLAENTFDCDVARTPSPLTTANILMQKAALLRHRNRFACALQVYETLAMLVDKLGKVWQATYVRHLAHVLNKVGRSEDALIMSGKGLSLLSHMPSVEQSQAVLRHAQILIQLGRRGEAELFLLQANSIDCECPFQISNRSHELAWHYYVIGDKNKAMPYYIKAVENASAAFAQNIFKSGVATTTKAYDNLFDEAFNCACECWQDDPTEVAFWQVLRMADAGRCVYLRQRIAQVRPELREGGVVRLANVGCDAQFFRAAAEHATKRHLEAAANTSSPRLRCVSSSVGDALWQTEVHQLPDKDFHFAMQDEDTLIVHFVRVKNEMSIVTVRKKSEAEGVEGNILRLAEPVSAIADACSKLEMEVLAAKDRFSGDLYQMLSLDRLLHAVAPSREMQERLHIVIVPDGPLVGIPLHAIEDSHGECLLERVSSVRYAASLSSLIWQARHDVAQRRVESCARWRATFFGNPGTVFECADSEPKLFCGVRRVDEICEELDVKCHEALEFVWTETGRSNLRIVSGSSLQVERELEFVLNNTRSVEWSVFSESTDECKVCSRDNFALSHRTADIVWLAAHGGLAVDRLPSGEEFESYSVLLCDGVVSCERMLVEEYDFSATALFHSSCCWLAKGESLGFKEIDGFVSALTSLGCRRISASLWELDDRAALLFANHFSNALSEFVFDSDIVHPHGFAKAFKQAVMKLRREEGMGGVAKWAPFILFGVG